jgi:hypothetical protein
VIFITANTDFILGRANEKSKRHRTPHTAMSLSLTDVEVTSFSEMRGIAAVTKPNNQKSKLPLANSARGSAICLANTYAEQPRRITDWHVARPYQPVHL